MEIQCVPGCSVDVPEFGIAIEPTLNSDASLIRFVLTQLADQTAIAAQARHDIRNHLNSVTVGLRLLKDEFEAGETDEAGQTFEAILGHLKVLNSHPALVRSS